MLAQPVYGHQTHMLENLASETSHGCWQKLAACQWAQQAHECDGQQQSVSRQPGAQTARCCRMQQEAAASRGEREREVAPLAGHLAVWPLRPQGAVELPQRVRLHGHRLMVRIFDRARLDTRASSVHCKYTRSQ